ncbi:MAG: hypothetical protein JWL74_300 [Alphaproteobacteria bacterium]|nr:hypothetical protein [Alphaproteobacteria bacterium]
MDRTGQRLAVAGMLALLAGCVAPGRPTPPVTERPGPQAGHPVADPDDPLMGRTASGLIGLFGRPALDVQEGAARKLQFSGASCVLDLYLYAQRRGGEPVSTHADARLPDGRDADRDACAASLSSR